MIPYANGLTVAEAKSEEESGQQAMIGDDIHFAVEVVDTMITDDGRPYLFAVHEGK
jgi:hypothetical protein